MGTYLNPNSRNFQEAVNSEIYIDKTEMIQVLNPLIKTLQKFVLVTRPPKFGKTMAADMICAYYDRSADNRELFAKRKLAECAPLQTKRGEIRWDTYLGQFDVIHVVMTDFIKADRTIPESLHLLAEGILHDLNNAYPGVKFDPSDLPYSMDRFFRHSNIPFVFVIDEWDAVFRIRKDDTEGQRRYLNFLRCWLKDRTYVALAYMTGILPIRKFGNQTSLNMFNECTILSPMQMAEYTGFTENEVRDLCRKYEMDFSEISNRYGGYLISTPFSVNVPDAYHKGGSKEYSFSVYNPFSVVSAMRTGIIENYWAKAETSSVLVEYIHRDYDGLRESVALLMDGGKLRINTSTYLNDMIAFHSKDDILSLLVHLGYLGFDEATSEVFIPNREILDVFMVSK